MTKHHNWVTGPNHKVVDTETDTLARTFIDECIHLTPAIEARLDHMFAEMERNAPEKDLGTFPQRVCKPNEDILAILEAPPEADWDTVEPPPEAYQYDCFAEPSADVVSQ